MYEGRPQFDHEGWYVGPLPRRSGGAPLIGKQQGVFKTAQSAAWPPALCKWTASALLTPFLQECSGEGEFLEEVSKKRKAEEEVGTSGKLQRRHLEDAAKCEVDPMNPPFPGGEGPPRSCVEGSGSFIP